MPRRFYQYLKTAIIDTAELWWFPALMGTATVAVVWAVWYLTKVPCTVANAVAYQCNPSAIANYIDVEILARCITLGAIAATLAGGLNIYMFAKEREARIAAENQLAEERKNKDKLLEEIRAEWRAERQAERQYWQEQLTEERRRSDEQLTEERRRSEETQRVLLAAIAELTARSNGNGSAN